VHLFRSCPLIWCKCRSKPGRVAPVERLQPASTAWESFLLDGYLASRPGAISGLRPASSGAYEVTPPTRAFSSVEAFRDLVGRHAGIGISEFIFYFPGAKDQRLVMEDVATLCQSCAVRGNRIGSPRTRPFTNRSQRRIGLRPSGPYSKDISIWGAWSPIHPTMSPRSLDAKAEGTV
jgi:hypothetical protein